MRKSFQFRNAKAVLPCKLSGEITNKPFFSREMFREKLGRAPYLKMICLLVPPPWIVYSHPIVRPMQTCRHAALGPRAVVDDMVKDLFEKLAEGKVPRSNLCAALDICVESTWLSKSN